MIMEARAITEATQEKQAVLASMLVHAEICTHRGQYHQAAQLYRQVMAGAIDQDDPSDRPNALYGLGRVHYEWNELPEARSAAETAVEAGRKIGDERLVVEATLLLARVEQTSGQDDRAQALLNGLMASPLWPRVHRQVQTWQARLHIRSGDLAAAKRALDVLAKMSATIDAAQQELEDFTFARLAIAQGNADEALVRVTRWQADAVQEGRGRSEVEALILAALAYDRLGEAGRAREALREALDLAQAGDQRRLFIDEGEPMIALLKALLDAHDEPYASYARVLLHAVMATQTAMSGSAQASGLIEPLSVQERRVLRLLVAGLSNADIAEELVVSVNTIKTQLKSIYHKLSVRSREEACDAAHDLHLA
jgi:LuxR family maltose regulon positive regulatory protein